MGGLVFEQPGGWWSEIWSRERDFGLNIGCGTQTPQSGSQGASKGAGSPPLPSVLCTVRHEQTMLEIEVD